MKPWVEQGHTSTTQFLHSEDHAHRQHGDKIARIRHWGRRIIPRREVDVISLTTRMLDKTITLQRNS
jgi:hypothetical protein